MCDQAMIRVILVDDHPVVRFGLAAIIGLQPDMVVIAEAGSGGNKKIVFVVCIGGYKV